jgi:hypothetical protein
MGMAPRDPEGALQALLATVPYGPSVSERLPDAARIESAAAPVARALPYGEEIVGHLARNLGGGEIRDRVNILGESPVTALSGVPGALSPLRISQEQDNPVMAAFRQAGEGLPSAAPKTLPDPDTKVAVPLTPDQQIMWKRAFGLALGQRWTERGFPFDAKDLNKIERSAREDAANAVFGR